jgi:hypothetical protein
MNGHDLTCRTITSCSKSTPFLSDRTVEGSSSPPRRLTPIGLGPTPWERRAWVRGLGCSNLDGVSSYGTRMMRGNILLTFGGGDRRGWTGNGGTVEMKLCVGERLPWRSSVQGDGRASTGVAWRCFSSGQRSSKRLGVGGGSWGRFAAPAWFGRPIHAGGDPICRGESIYS